MKKQVNNCLFFYYVRLGNVHIKMDVKGGICNIMKIIKWIGIVFVGLFVIGLIGRLLGVEPMEFDTEKAKENATEVIEEKKPIKEEAIENEITEDVQEEKEEPKEVVQEKVSKPVIKDVQEKVDTPVWVNKINELAHNSDGVADKFYELEKFMMDYEASKEEVEQFGKDIIADYQSGTYLSEIDNHERMLTNIFKSYIVDQQAKEPMKELAFDYHQIMKYTYRGAETIDSDFVKENEYQIEKSLKKL